MYAWCRQPAWLQLSPAVMVGHATAVVPQTPHCCTHDVATSLAELVLNFQMV
jgi:hypothetical protein